MCLFCLLDAGGDDEVTDGCFPIAITRVGFGASLELSPALKRISRGEALSGALKRSFPRMNARAPT